MSNLTSVPKLFRTVLIQGSLLTLAIALVGAVAGYFTAGVAGIFGALIGSGITLLFTSMTALAVWFGGSRTIAVFFAVVLGGWLVKVIVFMIVLAALRDVEGIDHLAFFLSVVASIIGTLAIDTRLVLRSRVPMFEQ